jgi:Flp pilus assembly pilin Flp
MIDTVAVATRPRKAAALVEYALILSLVSLLVIGALALLGGQTGAVFASVAVALGGPQDAGNSDNGQSNNIGLSPAAGISRRRGPLGRPPAPSRP